MKIFYLLLKNKIGLVFVGIFALISFLFQDSFYFFIGLVLYILSFLLLLDLKKLKPAQLLTLVKQSAKKGKKNFTTKNSKILFKKHAKFSILAFLSFFILLLVATALITSFLFFFYNSQQNQALAYYQEIGKYYYKQLAALGLSLFAVIFILKIRNKKVSKILALLSSALQSFGIICLALLFSLPLLLALGIANVNYALQNIKNYPDRYYIATDYNFISDQIAAQDKFPQIIVTQDKLIDKLITDTSFAKSKESFYEKVIFPKALNYKYITIQLEPNIIYSGNILYLGSLDDDLIVSLSHSMVEKLFDNNFSQEYKKDVFPEMSFISRQEYTKHRDAMIDEQIEEIKAELAEVEADYNRAAAATSSLRSDIQEAEAALNRLKTSKDSDYNNCIDLNKAIARKEGYGDEASAIIEEYCQGVRAEYEAAIHSLEVEIPQMKSSLAAARAIVNSLKDIVEDYESYQAFIESSKHTLGYELGIFEPDNQIKVVKEENDPSKIADYLSIIMHEYLHYSSYISDDEESRLLPFFEESLTEYFSRKSITESLGEETNIGYPLLVKIISGLIEDVGEEKFLEIYFSKDEAILASTLNETYGEGFYEESKIYFQLIPFIEREEELKYANTIQTRIGKAKLTDDDFPSEESSYQGEFNKNEEE